MPTRPPEIDERIKEAVNGKVPYFFMEAKNKPLKNVESINNSTVNRIRGIIPNIRMKFTDIVGEFNYKMLMSKDISYVNKKIIEEYRKLDRSKKWIIRSEGIKDRSEGLLFVYKYIKDKLKEIESDEEKIANVLIKELFANKNSPNKETLWHCYGDIMLNNLLSNLNKTKQCENCGTRIELVNNKVKYCSDCKKNIDRYKAKERMKNNRK